MQGTVPKNILVKVDECMDAMHCVVFIEKPRRPQSDETSQQFMRPLVEVHALA